MIDSGQELGTSRVQTLQSEESNYGAMNPKSPGLTSILGIGIGLRTSTVGICFLGKKGCIPMKCYCLTRFEVEPQFGKNHSQFLMSSSNPFITLFQAAFPTHRMCPLLSPRIITPRLARKENGGNERRMQPRWCRGRAPNGRVDSGVHPQCVPVQDHRDNQCTAFTPDT